MEAMKNVGSAHVSDLKLLKGFYLAFGIFCKIHSIREISQLKRNIIKKTIGLSLLDLQLLRIYTD